VFIFASRNAYWPALANVIFSYEQKKMKEAVTDEELLWK
jgi:hypothetical protein